MSLDELLIRRRHERRGAEAEVKAENYNLIVRRSVSDVVEAIGLTLPGSPLDERLTRNNVALMAPGSWGGKVLEKENSELHAISPGTFMRRRLVVGADAVIDGVSVFTVDGTDCVNVKAGASVLFRGCTFQRDLDSDTSMVTIDAAAKVVFLGCVFRGSGTTVAPMVQHAGPAANVQIAFCYNKTGNTLFTAGTATGTGNI
jgi:hypothetical protein